MWEYKCVEMRFDHAEFDHVFQLNAMGAKGWELVEVIQPSHLASKGTQLAILKRTVREEGD